MPELEQGSRERLRPVNREVEHRIDEMAARQHGVVSREQILGSGLSSSALGRRVRSGRLRPLHRGVYVVGPIVPSRAAEMAAVLASAGGVLSHASAASLWGWRPRQPAQGTAVAAPIDITIAGANRGRRPGIRLHRVEWLDPAEHTLLDSIPITTPGRTLVDLAAVVGTRELESAVAWAEREGLVHSEALSALLERHRGRSGTRALRAILGAPGGPAFTRSVAEAKFLALVREAGLPAPDANVRIGPYEIDFLWRSSGIAVEVDGFRHHSLRPRFEGDRRKDAWLLAAGIHVVRLSWRQIAHEGMRTAVQLGHALLRAREGPLVRSR